MDIKPSVSPRAIQLLVYLRQACFDDDALSLKATRCGSIAAAHIIDDLIGNALRLETHYHDAVTSLYAERQENAAYRELFGGYTPDILNEKEKEQIRAIVSDWRADDETD